jgi:hypothetical protein
MTEIRHRYELTADVMFEYDPEKVDLTHWLDPDTMHRRHRMEGIYPGLVTQDQLLDHLAYNALVNGVTDASRLDGWGDLERGALTMCVREAVIERA